MKMNSTALVEEERAKLANLYRIFEHQINKRDFYNNVAVYVDFVRQSPVFGPFTNELENEVRLNLKRINKEVVSKRLAALAVDLPSSRVVGGKIDVTPEHDRILNEFEDDRNASYWGAWERLLWVYFALRKPLQYPDYERKPGKLKTNERFYYMRTKIFLHFRFELLESVGHRQVDDEIRSPQLLNVIRNKSDDPNKIEHFRNYAAIIHTYLLNQTYVPDNHQKSRTGSNSSKYYITKKGEDFFYDERPLNLSTRSEYFRMFSALYAKVPYGGEVSYGELIKEIRSRMRAKKKSSPDVIKKKIHNNLTARTSGYRRAASDIPETLDNGKRLIDVVRGYGIRFNNKR